MAAELTVAVGLGCSLVGAIVGIGGYKRSVDKENADAGKDRGVLLTELGYIKAGIDDIKREQRDQEGKHNQLAERVTRVEESAKQAHHRIDRMEKGE